ncbi:MAG: hypothetical protein SFX73_21160 [Kofleriaceae bacterium]|nr:hypothetical protein [Kofleriaceae bacterium]
MRSRLLLSLVLLYACAPRVSVAYDASARLSGPLANTNGIARLTAVTGLPVRPPPEGKTFSLGVGGGTRWLTVGGRLFANNISGVTLDAYTGPQFVSAGAALDIRGALALIYGLSATLQVSPTRTLLIDTTRGDSTWGNGFRYGAGLSYGLWMVHVYADLFQEQLWFAEGPATGNSTRTGITVGLAFQP